MFYCSNSMLDDKHVLIFPESDSESVLFSTLSLFLIIINIQSKFQKVSVIDIYFVGFYSTS